MVEKTSQMNTRIRLVRCPRCLKVLPELPEIPVYQCGGCGAVLQAKNRKKDSKEAELSSHETNSLKNYEDECVSDGSNQESTLPVLESSPVSEYKGDEYGNENQESSPGSDDYKGDEFGNENQESSPGSDYKEDELGIENQESSPGSDYKGDDFGIENQEPSPGSEYKGDEFGITNQESSPGSEYKGDEFGITNQESSPGSDYKGDDFGIENQESSPGSDYKGDEYGIENQESSPGSDYKGDEFGIKNQTEQPGDTSFSDELPSSIELNGDGTEKLSIEAIDTVEKGENKFLLSEDVGKHGNENLNHESELPGNRISSGELPNPAELSYSKNEDSSLEIGIPMEQDNWKVSLKQRLRKYVKESEETPTHGSELPTNGISSDELPISDSYKNEDSSLEIEEPMKQDIGREPLKQKIQKYVNECEETLNNDSELPGNRISSDELPNSGELEYSKNEDSSLEIREPMKQDKERDLLEEKIQKYVKESEDSCIKQTGDREYSDELDSTGDLSYQNSETSSLVASNCIKLNGEKDTPEPYFHGDQKDHGDVKGDKPEGNQSELSPGEGDKSLYLVANIKGKSQDRSGDQIEESSQIIESTMVARDKLDTSPMISGIHDDSMIRSKSLVEEGSLTPKKEDVIIAAESPLNEGILSDNLSPDDIDLEKSQKKVQAYYERLSSTETFKSLPVMTRDTRRAMSKSPTRIYYGDGASESSYDGLDDQVLDQPSHLYKRKSKATEVSSTHRPRRKDGSKVNKVQNSRLETHREETASSWMYADNNKYAITRQEWRDDELPEPRRHDHSVRRGVTLDNEEPLSRKPHIPRSSQHFNENGSPSRYVNNVFHSPDKTSYTESDKIELLRMVYELENKLSRTSISKQMENGRFYSGDQRGEKHTPKLYEDSYLRGIRWSGPSKISRLASSSEVAYCRQQIDCSCSHCYPHNWQCSRHSPSHSNSCSKCQYTGHPGHTRHKAFSTHALTPQQYTTSEASSWGERERKSDNQKHTEHEVKRLYSEKYHAAKRHLRPIAGGAPIIVCHYCSELLQLPMDFLVFKKRFHQLRCNSCNRIQKFSLQKKVHLVPYAANASNPPPSEVDDAHSRTLAPMSHSNDLPPAEPVSCSDHYDPSFSKSYSTEQDPPLLALKRNTNKGKATHNDSSQPREDRKINSESIRSRSQYLSSREQFESVGSSSKMSIWGQSTSEIQEVPASGSTLHLLMGYSSPRHVLYAAPTDDSEVETRYRYT